MKKVIVTGINGLIGQYISKPLKDLDFEVYGIGRKDFITDKFNYKKCDINNSLETKSLFKEIKPQYLIHLAWDTNKGYLESDDNFDLVASSINMLKYFRENGGEKALFTGTCFEYKFKDYPIKEEDELKPNTIYAKCKNYLREISELYCDKNNIDFCWARIFYTYGKNENNKRLFPQIINGLKNNQKVSINHSHLKRDYIFAGDVAKAISLVLNSKFNGIINICSGKSISLENIAITIAKKLNKLELLDLKKLETKEPDSIVGDNSILLNNFNFNYREIENFICSDNEDYVNLFVLNFNKIVSFIVLFYILILILSEINYKNINF